MLNAMRWKRVGAGIVTLFLMGAQIPWASADIRSKDPKDPYSIRFIQTSPSQEEMRLCGPGMPDDCKPLGIITKSFDQNDLAELRGREETDYVLKKYAEPVATFVIPAGWGVKAVFEVKVVVRLSERYLPKFMDLMYAKFGKGMTVKVLAGANATVDTVKMALIAKKLSNEVIDPKLNKAAQEAISEDGLEGQDIVVDYSIRDLAEHLEGEVDAVHFVEQNPEFENPIPPTF